MKENKLTKKINSGDITKKTKGLWQDFKAFLTRGNILDLAVGVIIGGAFNAIVTAFTKILMSICTWGVPGGIDGLVTILPAINSAQRGDEFAGQFFSTGQETVNAVVAYAQKSGATEITGPNSTGYLDWQDALLKNYTLYGNRYAYNGSNVINWGSLINAIITFLIIAITLFVIVKVAKFVSAKRIAYQKAIEEKIHNEYLLKHPEEAEKERLAEEEKNKPAPKPDDILLLEEIRDELKRLSDRETVK